MGLPKEQLTEFLPADRQEWRYYSGAADDYSGFRGYFASDSEVDRLAAALSKGISTTEAAT